MLHITALSLVYLPSFSSIFHKFLSTKNIFKNVRDIFSNEKERERKKIYNFEEHLSIQLLAL